MSRWVALLRGINVGGANKLAMADLRALASDLGWEGVQTYVASGNMVFSATGEAAQLAATLAEAIRTSEGLDLSILVLSDADLAKARGACPFKPDDPRHVHVIFALDKPDMDNALLDRLKGESENFALEGRIAYLHAPEGFGRSKLAGRLEHVMRSRVTARNLRSIDKLVELTC